MNQYGRNRMKQKLLLGVFILLVLGILGLIKSCIGQ